MATPAPPPGGGAGFDEFAASMPPPLPDELEDICSGSWGYFYRVHSGGGSTPQKEERQCPSPAVPPRRVGVRFHVHDIKEINEVAGTVHVDFTVLLTWTDPLVAAAAAAATAAAAGSVSPPASPPSSRPPLLRSMSSSGGGGALSPGGSGSAAALLRLSAADVASLWLPGVTVANAVDLAPLFDPTLCVRVKDAGAGRMEQRLRWRGLINNRMDLRCFPFDADLLLLTLSVAGFPAGLCTLIPDPLSNPRDTHVRHSLSEWELDPPPTVVTGVSTATGDSIDANAGAGALKSQDNNGAAVVAQEDAFSTCHLVLRVHRNPFYYIWKMVLVQEIVAVWSWSVFFHDCEDISGRMSTTLTLFLSSVAFLHVINDRLPRMPYLTVMDKFTYVSFFLLFLTAYENLFAFYLAHHLGNRQLAESADVASRVVFPLLHIASCIGLAFQVRNSRRTELELGNEL